MDVASGSHCELLGANREVDTLYENSTNFIIVIVDVIVVFSHH